MIEARFTRDLDFLDEIIRRPEVYAWGTDDFSDAMEEISVGAFLEDSRTAFVEITDGPERLGFFLGVPMGDYAYRVHACLVRECRGRRAKEACRRAIDLVFDRTRCEYLVAEVSTRERHAYLMARWMGFEPIAGTSSERGKFVDGVLYPFRTLCLPAARWREEMAEEQEGVLV